VKPVLRKNNYSSSNNVIMMFRSVEIYFIDQDIQNEKTKKLSPIYIPPMNLKDILNLDKNKLEIFIMEKISYD